MTADPSLGGRVIRGTAWLMAWRMASRALGFVSTLVLARLLAPADFGIVALAYSISAAADSLSQVGVRDALVRLGEERREWFDAAFTIQAARGVLTAGVIALVALWSDGWAGDGRVRGVLFALAALAVVSGFENIGVVTITRQLNFRAQVMMQIVPRLIGFAVTVTLAFVLRDYRALVWGTAAARLSGVAVTYAASPHRPRFGLAGWRYLVGFSAWTWAASLAAMVWNRSDPWLLAPVLSAANLGVYVLGAEVGTLPVTELLEPACGALFPGFALAQRTGSAPLTVALTIAGVLALIMLPLGIGLSATAGYAVAGLLGPGWQQVQPVVATLAWVCLLSPFSYVCGAALTARGEVKRAFVASAASSLVKAAAILAVRHTGDLDVISGAVVIAVAAEALFYLWQLRLAGAAGLRRLSGCAGRAAIAGTAMVLLLRQLPLTWQAVALPQLWALLEGGAIALGSIAAFGMIQMALWLAAGRPEGPESWLADRARQFQAHLRDRRHPRRA